MFESFKNFISDFVDGEKHPSQFDDNDYRLAAAALLVHAAAIDGERLRENKSSVKCVAVLLCVADGQKIDLVAGEKSVVGSGVPIHIHTDHNQLRHLAL